MKIALATCVTLPELDVDAPLLHDALVARGAEVELLAWDDPASVFDADVSVVRSTWNYWLPGNHARFVAWIERTAKATRLFNPARVLAWNLHKRYLVELAQRGVPVVPTVLLERGERRSLDDVMRALSAEKAVIKPAVSAGSYRTRMVRSDDRVEGEAFLRALCDDADTLVQPYVASVEGWGERSIVCIDGELMHAVRKNPRFGGEHESVSAAMAIEPDERALAEQALATIPEALLYARIDMARDDHGKPMIMELELCEPSLFLAQNPAALARFADAIVARA